MKPGALNLITDVAGLRVGNASDDRVKTGATVLVGDAPFVAAVHVMGGAPGTRETDLLAPDKLVQEANALVLSGGSALGLDTGSGVADALREARIGFDVRGQIVPIVPGAILQDLTNGGAKDWSENPYKRLGREALASAAREFVLGSAGAGTGATVADVKGGLGSASLVLDNGLTIGALAAVNAEGTAIGPDGRFWAAQWEMDGEFGGRGPVTDFDPGAMPVTKRSDRPGNATTIAIVATDAALSQAQLTRLAVAAHDGMARALVPSHSLFDGDLVFAAATGAKPLTDPIFDPLLLGHAAATCLARAIARGVYAATPAEGDVLPTWMARFGAG